MKVEEVIRTPFGPMRLVSEKDEVLALDFLWNTRGGTGTGNNSGIAKKVVRELQEFAQGKRKKFDVRVSSAVKGTDFQKKVWAILRKIPYGRTLTYRDIAVKMGNPYFARAVGQALRANRVAIIIPCHRVVAANGLGGYAGKEHLDVKVRLLEIEKAAK